MRPVLRPLGVLALLGGALALAPVAAPASASTGAASVVAEPLSGPCVAADATSPTCAFEYGTVQFVADGDTLDVRIDSSPSTPSGTVLRVRMIGINAMEQYTYSSDPARRTGECHSLEATQHLEQLAPIGSRVRLSARDLAGRSGDRYRRSVAYVDGGEWKDAGERLVQLGDALWLANPTEYGWNRTYNALSQQAAQADVGLWDNNFCGDGPNQGSTLQVYAQWDADGTDGVDLNGEYVRIRNRNRSTAVDLSGWWLRDSFLRGTSKHGGFVFPAGSVLAAGQTFTVHAGAGVNTATTYYWGQTSPVFDNVTGSPTSMGDGAYLFDRQGDLRFSSTYPCASAALCADPLDGKVAISKVQYDAPGDDATNPNGEYVQVTSTGTAPIDLQGYQVVNAPYVYDFYQDSVLQPGETLTLSVGSGTSTRLQRYWRKPAGIFNNGGETVRVDNYSAHTLACRSWGTGRC